MVVGTISFLLTTPCTVSDATVNLLLLLHFSEQTAVNTFRYIYVEENDRDYKYLCLHSD